MIFLLQRDDTSLLAQFYFADEELNLVASELDSFDGRKDPERCTALVNQLRHCQDKVPMLLVDGTTLIDLEIRHNLVLFLYNLYLKKAYKLALFQIANKLATAIDCRIFHLYW